MRGYWKFRRDRALCTRIIYENSWESIRPPWKCEVYFKIVSTEQKRILIKTFSISLVRLAAVVILWGEQPAAHPSPAQKNLNEREVKLKIENNGVISLQYLFQIKHNRRLSSSLENRINFHHHNWINSTRATTSSMVCKCTLLPPTPDWKPKLYTIVGGQWQPVLDGQK